MLIGDYVEYKQDTNVEVTGCPATVSVASAHVSHGRLVLALQVSASGTVTISGAAVRTTAVKLAAGTRHLSVPLNRKGRAAAHRHAKIKVQASLAADGQTGTRTVTLEA